MDPSDDVSRRTNRHCQPSSAEPALLNSLCDRASPEVGGDGGHPTIVGGECGGIGHRAGDQDGRVPQRGQRDRRGLHQGFHHPGKASLTCSVRCNAADGLKRRGKRVRVSGLAWTSSVATAGSVRCLERQTRLFMWKACQVVNLRYGVWRAQSTCRCHRRSYKTHTWRLLKRPLLPIASDHGEYWPDGLPTRVPSIPPSVLNS